MPQNLITCDSLVLPDQLFVLRIFCQWGVITGSPQGDPSAGLYVNGVGWGVIECLKVIILSVLKPDLSNNGYEATSDIVTTVGDSKVVKRQIGDCASISSKLYHSSRVTG